MLNGQTREVYGDDSKEDRSGSRKTASRRVKLRFGTPEIFHLFLSVS